MQNIKLSLRLIITIPFLTLILTVGIADLNTANAHGGKTHGGNQFTALQAVQKAIQLYDRLIIDGKLDETWETGLKSIDVNTREKDGIIETRVGFQRSAGSPGSVYIFFSADGSYSGSNFDGNW